MNLLDFPIKYLVPWMFPITLDRAAILSVRKQARIRVNNSVAKEHRNNNDIQKGHVQQQFGDMNWLIMIPKVHKTTEKHILSVCSRTIGKTQ